MSAGFTDSWKRQRFPNFAKNLFLLFTVIDSYISGKALFCGSVVKENEIGAFSSSKTEFKVTHW